MSSQKNIYVKWGCSQPKFNSVMLFVCWALKQYLIYLLEQEAAFRKVVQATMVRDRQHGPVVELNRIQVHQEIHANICTLIICFTITSFQVPPSSSSLFLSLGGRVPDRLLSVTCDVFHKGIFLWCV